jgi:hypothetical protein
VNTTNLNYLQKEHIPQSVQTSKNFGSKSSSVTSFVTTDLRHSPQNFWGFKIFSVAVNFHPRCLWQYRHPAIVHAYLQHMKFLQCQWQNILQVILMLLLVTNSKVQGLFWERTNCQTRKKMSYTEPEDAILCSKSLLTFLHLELVESLNTHTNILKIHVNHLMPNNL